MFPSFAFINSINRLLDNVVVAGNINLPVKNDRNIGFQKSSRIYFFASGLMDSWGCNTPEYGTLRRCRIIT